MSKYWMQPKLFLAVTVHVTSSHTLDRCQLKCCGHQSPTERVWKTRIAGLSPHTASTTPRSAARVLVSLEEKATFWVLLSQARPLLRTHGPGSTHRASMPAFSSLKFFLKKHLRRPVSPGENGVGIPADKESLLKGCVGKI